MSPEDDVEIRRLTITNHGRAQRDARGRPRYFEIALAAQASDQAHKSFSNLFVETESLARHQRRALHAPPAQRRRGALLGTARRSRARPRSATSRFETDRAAFLGRLRGADDPAALDCERAARRARPGRCSTRAARLRRTVTVPPGESVRLVFTTGVAETAATRRVRLTEKYSDPRSAQRAIDLAWTAAQLELRDLGISPQEAVDARAARVAPGAHRPVLAAQDQDARRERPADVGPVVDRHLRRPAHPARARRGARARAARAPGAARAPVLAPQGARPPTSSSSTRAPPATPTNSTTGCGCSSAPATRCSCSTSPAASSCAAPTRCIPTCSTCCSRWRAPRSTATRGTIELQLNRRGKRPPRPDALVTTRERGARRLLRAAVRAPAAAVRQRLRRLRPGDRRVRHRARRRTSPRPRRGSTCLRRRSSAARSARPASAARGRSTATRTASRPGTTIPVSDGSRRGDLRPRRGDRRVLEPDAAARAHAGALRHPPRHTATSRFEHETHGIAHRPRLVHPAERPDPRLPPSTHQHCGRAAQALGHAVRRVGSRRLEVAGAAARRDVVRRRDRHAHRAQPPQPRLPGPLRVPRLRPTALELDGEPHRVRRPQRPAERPGRDGRARSSVA